MFWVVQNNLYKEYGYNKLLDAIERLDIKHTIVKPIPIIERLAPIDLDSFVYNGPADEIPEPYIDESGLVMVCGSLTLANIAKKRGWVPGSFNNENFDYSIWNKIYKENLLNYNAKVCKFNEVKPWWNEFFIRPCEDNKAFTGYVTPYIDFDLWRQDVLSVKNDLWILKENTEVMVAPLKTIYNENRFFVVDGKIVTYSQYKVGENVIHSDVIGHEIIEFAEKMVDLWKPSRAFVIDIATTSEGLKVIELNCFNSAGFYACDVYKIVDSVESMIF